MEVVTNTEGSLVGKDDNSEQKIQKSWRKKLLGFLASYVGLFVLLLLYVVGGAYLFYQRESEFELEMKNEMMENHREAFIIKVFWYLACSKFYRKN